MTVIKVPKAGKFAIDFASIKTFTITVFVVDSCYFNAGGNGNERYV